MKNVTMCGNCQADYIDEVEKFVTENGASFETGCIGMCGQTPIFAQVDGTVIEAETVADLLNKMK